MSNAIGYAVRHSFSDLRPMAIERRAPEAHDISIDILYCGVCHSDVHQARNEWKNTVYPCMPGHEIVGRVTAVGAAVTRFGIGDVVGVGCMVDSCRSCTACREGLENYCEKGFLSTYNGNQRHPSEENLTYGGYSDSIVVNEDFVLRIPASLTPAGAAPLLCAGVTTFSPMKHWGVTRDSKVGVIGFGGLGQLATKIAAALGADVTVITTSANKVNDALAAGATRTVLSTDDAAMQAHANSLDFMISTIPESHDVNPYIALLKRDGVCVVVGCIMPLKGALDLSKMIPDRKTLGTSLIGSIAETQEILEFCAAHGIESTVKVIAIDEVNEAFARVNAGDVDFRYVIDMATIRNKTPDESVAATLGL